MTPNQEIILSCADYAAFEIFLTEGSKFFGVLQNGK